MMNNYDEMGNFDDNEEIEITDLIDDELEAEMEKSVAEDQFDVEVFNSVKADKKLKTEVVSTGGMSRREIKTVVDLFYQVQKDRIALQNQIRAIKQAADEDSKDHNNLIVLNYLFTNMKIMETNTASIIKTIVQNDPVGQWLTQIIGIGDVLAAGLIAYLDVEGVRYATHFISFAGLNDNNRPWLGKEKSRAIVNEIIGKDRKITDEHVERIATATQWKVAHIRKHAYNEGKNKWDKEKIIKACAMVPYNRNLKKLMFKVGSSFRYQCNKKDSVYGTILSERRAQETELNEQLAFADQAKHKLETTDIKVAATRKIYESGKLPKAHINMRAMRYTEKIFLCHLFEEMYRVKYDQIPPRYYVLEHVEGHHKDIAPEVPYTRVTGEA